MAGNGIKTKNIPQAYSELIYNGNVKDDVDAYELELWIESLEEDIMI